MEASAIVRDLYAHMEWADAIVWRAVLTSPAAAEDGRIRALLTHLHATERAFIDTWQKKPFEYRETSFNKLADVVQYARQCHEDLAGVRAGFSRPAEAGPDTSFDGEFVVPWAKYFARSRRVEAAPTTLGETLLQLPMHSTYHRGQVNARLREIGGEPPLTDYIAWLWFGRPSPEWP